MKKLNLLLGLVLLASSVSFSQNVGINTTGAAPDAGAGLDINFNNKGVLVPRVNIINLNTIAPITGSATTSLLVYNTNAGTGLGYHYWDGARWVRFATGGESWQITGNNNTNATNFLGTTNAQPLIFRTDNAERMRIQANGRVGIGTNNPATHFEFNKPVTVTNFHMMFDNTLAGDAIARFQHTNANNGNRVLFGVSNYNGNLNASPGVIGIHLNTVGNGGIGVEGFSNSTAATGIQAGFAGGNTFVPGWALFSDGWAGGTTNWQTISDERIKRDISPIESAIEKIKLIQGVEYYYRTADYPELNIDTETKQTGFIAQNIESVFPHLVREANINGNKSPMENGMSKEKTTYTLKTFSYSSLVPVLLQGIKEQQTKIESLEERIEALENAINE